MACLGLAHFKWLLLKQLIADMACYGMAQVSKKLILNAWLAMKQRVVKWFVSKQHVVESMACSQIVSYEMT